MRYPVRKIQKNDICAEVGVWRGDFSSEILKESPKELHLIDPWVHQEYEWVKWAKGQAIVDAYNHVVKKFHDDQRVTIYKRNSLDVFLGENYFDWVYIDGDHSYDSVIADLNHWFPQVKSGGFLCGDDYGWSHELTEGPKRAVDEFVKSHSLKLATKGHKASQFIIFA